MRLIKFKFTYSERAVYINPEYVESVASTYDYQTNNGRDNECSIGIVGSDSAYHVEGSLEEVVAKLIGD